MALSAAGDGWWGGSHGGTGDVVCAISSMDAETATQEG